jgi:hypothetical protein
MKYYLHDSNAFNDEKITELYIKFGYEGLGLFYTLLEKIASQEKPIKTSVLKSQLKVGKKLDKCWKFMEEIEIISSNNGDTFNKQLMNFSEKYKIKSEKNAKRISDWREKQSLIKNVTCYEHVCNTCKVKRSKYKVKKRIIRKRIHAKIIPFDFKKSLLNLGIESKIVDDWIKVRKTKKGSNTETAFNDIKKQIEKSGKTANECIKIAVIKSWCGFEYKWLENIQPDIIKINESDRLCYYLNEARQQVDKKVKGTYSKYLREKEVYQDKIKFLEYV